MAKAREGQDAIELEHLSHSFEDDHERSCTRKLSISSISDADVDDAAGESGKDLYSPIEERAVVRKLDRRLVLFVAILYMLSFLDRSSMSKETIFHLHFELIFSKTLATLASPALPRTSTLAHPSTNGC